VKTSLYCILLVASLAGNSFVGIIVCKTRTIRKTINFFIVNMAMSDLLYSIFAFPWALTELNAGSWLISGILDHTLCKMISFVKVVSTAVSIQSLVLIAVDRFGAVVFPLRSPLIGPKLCPFLILATWIFAITTQFPYYYLYKFVEYPEKLACEVRREELFDESSYYVLKNYFIALSILELYIPFALMTILYSIILCKLKIQRVPGVQSVNTEHLYCILLVASLAGNSFVGIIVCKTFALMAILYSIILYKLRIQRVPGVQSVNTENIFLEVHFVPQELEINQWYNRGPAMSTLKR